ncbi:MAG: hypothetical protein HPY76_09930, partial [Anaerolineae bacterium]|nr:hypothetical protein [Anaerolineae bacterium]
MDEKNPEFRKPAEPADDHNGDDDMTSPGDRLRRLLSPPPEENLTMPLLSGEPKPDDDLTRPVQPEKADQPDIDRMTIRLPGEDAAEPESDEADTRPNHIDPSEARTVAPAPGSGIDPSLPVPVDVYDQGATQVTPAAYWQPSIESKPPHSSASTPPVRPPRSKPTSPPPQRPRKADSKRKKRKDGDSRGALGCTSQGLIIAMFLIILSIIIVASIGVYQYFSIARTLPDVDELYDRASQFETTRILDRDGNLLYEILDPNAGRRTYVPLDRISPYLVAATIATEDKEFYNHPGFDPVALVRALWQNYTSGEVVSGASTI